MFGYMDNPGNFFSVTMKPVVGQCSNDAVKISAILCPINPKADLTSNYHCHDTGGLPPSAIHAKAARTSSGDGKLNELFIGPFWPRARKPVLKTFQVGPSSFFLYLKNELGRLAAS